MLSVTETHEENTVLIYNMKMHAKSMKADEIFGAYW